MFSGIDDSQLLTWMLTGDLCTFVGLLSLFLDVYAYTRHQRDFCDSQSETNCPYSKLLHLNVSLRVTYPPLFLSASGCSCYVPEMYICENALESKLS